MSQFEITRYTNRFLSVMTQVRQTLESVKSTDYDYEKSIIRSLQSLYKYLQEKMKSGKVNASNVDSFIPQTLRLTSIDKWDTYEDMRVYARDLLTLREKLSNI